LLSLLPTLQKIWKAHPYNIFYNILTIIFNYQLSVILPLLIEDTLFRAEGTVRGENEFLLVSPAKLTFEAIFKDDTPSDSLSTRAMVKGVPTLSMSILLWATDATRHPILCIHAHHNKH
jgi:hypothetical protein